MFLMRCYSQFRPLASHTHAYRIFANREEEEKTQLVSYAIFLVEFMGASATIVKFLHYYRAFVVIIWPAD